MVHAILWFASKVHYVCETSHYLFGYKKSFSQKDKGWTFEERWSLSEFVEKVHDQRGLSQKTTGQKGQKVSQAQSFFLINLLKFQRDWSKSSLKYLRKCEDTYFILQKKYLCIYEDSFGVKILRHDFAHSLSDFSQK